MRQKIGLFFSAVPDDNLALHCFTAATQSLGKEPPHNLKFNFGYNKRKNFVWEMLGLPSAVFHPSL